MSGPATICPQSAEAQKPRRLLRFLILVLLFGVLILCATWLLDRRAKYLENRRHEVSREEGESRVAIKAHPVLVMKGTANRRSFELVMRGFTNYFMKETWGAPRGARSFLGGQKPGGYSVVIRTKQFSGQWEQGWRGTHGGGGGGGFDVYQNDLLPGRWLWNRSGLAGAKFDHEYHHTSQSCTGGARVVVAPRQHPLSTHGAPMEHPVWVLSACCLAVTMQ
jgi:hypothetical protein